MYSTSDQFTYDAQTALEIPAVSRCVSVLSGDVSRLPVFEQVKLPDGSFEKVDQSPVSDLLNGVANEYQSGNEWRSQAVRDLLLWGNHLSVIHRNGAGDPIAFQPLPFGSWSVNYVQDEYRLSYSISKRVDIAPSDVLHFRLDGTRPFWGEAPIMQHREVLETAIAQTRAASRTFRSSMGKVVLSSPDNLSPESVEKVQTKFASVHGDSKNWNTPIVTGGDMEAKVFQQELARNQYVEAQRWSVHEIARMYNVPASMLYASDAGGGDSFGTSQAEITGYIETGLRPLLKRIGDHMAMKLFPNEGRRIVFDVSEMSRGTYTESVSALRQGIDAGIINPAEARAMLQLPPGPEELDEFVMSKNYQQQSSPDADDVLMDASQGVPDEA